MKNVDVKKEYPQKLNLDKYSAILGPEIGVCTVTRDESTWRSGTWPIS